MKRVGLIAALVAVSLTTIELSAQTGAGGPLETAMALVRAIETSDIELLASTFDEDATVFMPLPQAPARLSGKAEIRRAFEQFFKAAGPGPRTITPRDLTTQSFGDLAVVTFHLGEPPRPGAAGSASAERFGRRTLVLRRTGDRWVIVHLHASNVSGGPG